MDQLFQSKYRSMKMD